MRWAPESAWAQGKWFDEVARDLGEKLWRACQEDWRSKNVRSVVSLDPDSCVYVRCARWRRYTSDGRFSKLTGSG